MLLKVAEINQKLLTSTKGWNFLEKKFQTMKFCERAHNNRKIENDS